MWLAYASGRFRRCWSCGAAYKKLSFAEPTKHCWRQRDGRIVVTSWVVLWILSNVDFHQLAVVKDRRVPLATTNTEVVARAIMRHPQSTCVGPVAVRISEEVDKRTLAITTHSLIVRPCVHHGAIVDADHDDLVDPFGLELVLSCKVSRDLGCGSRGSERSRQTDHDHFLSGASSSHLDFDVRVGHLDFHVRHLVTLSNAHVC